MLEGPVPLDVIERHRDKISRVMGGLAGIVRQEDGSLWSISRKECVEWTYLYFWRLGLSDLNLRPKLKKLGGTWNSEYCD